MLEREFTDVVARETRGIRLIAVVTLAAIVAVALALSVGAAGFPVYVAGFAVSLLTLAIMLWLPRYSNGVISILFAPVCAGTRA
jgi:hypothetical protein